MNTQAVFDFFNSNANFSPTTVLKQRWSRKIFSYMETPRPDYGIMLLTAGAITFHSKHQTLSASVGDVVFLPKGCYYDAIFHVDECHVENYLMNFDTDNAAFQGDAPTKILEKAVTPLRSDFQKQLEAAQQIHTSVLQRKGHFYMLLDRLCGYKENHSEKQYILQKAQKLLQEKSDLSVGEIARLCCTSESSLRRIFKENGGMSPVNYRTLAKLRQAVYLMNSTDLSIGEIADSLDFFDTAYFCKVFHAHMGITPKQYMQHKTL